VKNLKTREISSAREKNKKKVSVRQEEAREKAVWKADWGSNVPNLTIGLKRGPTTKGREKTPKF